jgi:RNA polymerase sigma-70 factor (TIGR02943 family)
MRFSMNSPNRTETDAAASTPDNPRSLDPEAWVDRHGDALYRYAMMRLHDADLASELVQETFLQAYRGRATFSGRASERTWLISILRHKIVDHLRRSGREEQTDPDGLGDERIFDRAGRWISTPAKWSGNPVEDMERGEFWACLHGCLSRLPSNIADAFLLRELEDCDADDVCKVLEITPANLHTRLYRARMLLRDCLGRRWFGASNSKERGG